MKEKFEQEQKDNHNHIEDLTMDMPDMEDDEKFRQWLEETYINEAELIEKVLLAGQEYEKNLDIAEELSVPREKFYQRLKEEGLYEDETEADESAETLDENLEISAESAETLKKMDGVSLAEETAETKTTGGLSPWRRELRKWQVVRRKQPATKLLTWRQEVQKRLVPQQGQQKVSIRL